MVVGCPSQGELLLNENLLTDNWGLKTDNHSQGKLKIWHLLN